MDEQNCGNCKYYIGAVCKRMPPYGGEFPKPPAGEKDWCGEWCEIIPPYAAPPAADALTEEKGE